MKNTYDQIDYHSHPASSFKTLMERYYGKVLYLTEILGSVSKYNIVYQDIIDLLKYGYDNTYFRRNMIINFKFNEKDKVVNSLNIRLFLYNLIFWKPFIIMDSVSEMNESYIFNFEPVSDDKSSIDEETINYIVSLSDEEIYQYFVEHGFDDKVEEQLGTAVKNYMDNVILKDCALDFGSRNELIAEISDNIRIISNAFGSIQGINISVYDIIQGIAQDKLVDRLSKMKFDTSMQPSEIENRVQLINKVLIKRFSKLDTGLRPSLRSGKNVSPDQFKEVMLRIGFKSDLNGDTVSYFIDCNILKDGINKASAYYLEAMSGRKALIMSKMKMGEPGAFSKKLINMTAPAVLRKDHLPCNTRRYIQYYITNEKQLKLLDKRYYYDENGRMKLLRFSDPESRNLLGKKVSFRSPITCSSPEGVCHICYGDLFDDNMVLPSTGAYAATKESEPYGQRILSSKHSQVTSSTVLKLCDDFRKVFELSSNEITLNQDFEDDVYIKFDNIEINDQGDSETYLVTTFDIVDNKMNTIYTIYEENETKFYLSEEMIKLYKKYKDKPIPISEFDDDSTILFQLEINNLELSKPLDNIETLLNKKDHFGCSTIDQLAQTYMDLKIEAGIMYNAVHDEMIIRELIRKKSDIYQKPDWGPNGDCEDYQILRMDEALYRSPSPITSLIAPWLKKQLVSPDFIKKSAPSPYDPFFMKSIAGIDPNEYSDENESEEPTE